MSKLIALLVILTALLFSLSCGKTGQQSGKKFTIAVIPKGTTHEFWKSIHAGADKAASEYGAQGTNVEVIWKGPARRRTRGTDSSGGGFYQSGN